MTPARGKQENLVDCEELHGKFGAASRTLLRLAIHSGSRTEYLWEASRVLLCSTRADVLDLWFEDGEQCYRWQAVVKPRSAHRLKSVAADHGRRERNSEGGPPAGSLLERILPLLDHGGRIAAQAEQTNGGSRWVNVPEREDRGDERKTGGDAFRCLSRSVAIIPFEIDGRNEGILRFDSTEPGFFSRKLVESYENLAQSLGAAMANRRAQAALNERIKELTCMYRIAQIASESNLSLGDTLSEIVEFLPPAWQHPEIASARIILDEQTFRSRGFEDGPYRLGADIVIHGIRRGRVDVFYTDRDSDSGKTLLLEENPFLEEERHLIQGVARELSSIIEHKHAEEEKARLLEQVRHADRLATIGQLAAGVAHELNEPLGNILGFAQLANKSPGLTGSLRSDIEKIISASLYAREIIRKMMFFSRQTPSRKMEVNLNKLVEDGLLFLESRCTKAGITVERRLERDLPVVLGDPAQLQQVLVNLVVNSIQAMPDGGKLTVGTTARDGAVILFIEDTGVGIAPENLKSVFMPFFTTKDVGRGTGLGLSVVHGIVNSHGGSIKINSAVGEGTCFEIHLPSMAETSGEGGRDGEQG